MRDHVQDETAALLAPMLKNTPFVAISHAVATADAIRPYIADHPLNECPGRARRAVRVGPVRAAGVIVGDGLSFLNTSDEAEARTWMDEEPHIKRGPRTFELQRWELREGRITVALSLSRSAVD